MLVEKVWFSVSALIHLKGVLSGSGQDSAVQSSLSTPNYVIHVFMDLALSLVTVMLEGARSKLFPQSWKHGSVKNILVS